MRIVLAMSGGVDSSAAATLLTQQGHEVIGLFMRSGATEEVTVCKVGDKPSDMLPIVNLKAHKQGCCSASDAADARKVADSMGIPFHALNFQDAFGRIKDYFADEYLAGRTPNPCVMCNNWLKFGKLWDFAKQIGADKIATGHYAQLVPIPGEETPALVRGVDRSKDQSYVLFGINRDLLDKIIFPVGTYQKSEIRELAHAAGLRNAAKPDSQEICFIPDNDYAGFLEKYRGPQDNAGEIVDTQGNVVGHHSGFQQYTIGQRKGLGAFGGPRFVVEIEPQSQRVVIGTKEELGRTGLIADRLNWHLADVPTNFRCEAQIRYQHTPAVCDVTVSPDGEMEVQFEQPQFGIAPGQAVVLYDNDRVIGGGWIRQSLRS
jgi:tRNA-specific 2-thiouridylase